VFWALSFGTVKFDPPGGLWLFVQQLSMSPTVGGAAYLLKHEVLFFGLFHT
jgi:hypothetical protein